VQSKLLGAEDVTIAYRRGPEQMNASEYEQDLAQTSGVRIRHWSTPKRLLVDGRVTGVELEYTKLESNGRLQGTGEHYTLPADVVFKAIGQKVLWDELGEAAEILDVEQGRIVVDDNGKSSLTDVWAGGDCVHGGQDLTVSAVQDGKVAAIAIDCALGR